MELRAELREDLKQQEKRGNDPLAGKSDEELFIAAEKFRKLSNATKRKIK